MMDKITSFVFFLPQGSWELNTRQRMILAFAKKLSTVCPKGKILCVERPVCLTTTPFLDPGKMLGWIRGRYPLRQITANLFLLTPWVPIHDRIALDNPLLSQCNNLIQGHQVRRSLKFIGVDDHQRVTWIYHPYQRNYCHMIRQDLLIYEVYDDYHEFAHLKDKKRLISQISKSERIILKKADIVFATASNICRRLTTLHPKVFLIPNGADADHFAASGLQHLPLPSEFENIPRPIIGFVGKINEQIDFLLINRLAERHPEWSFIFLGNFDGQNSMKKDPIFLQAKAKTNIYFLGWKNYAKLPKYIHAFDICLIPFVRNSLTQSIYPLKLHEYLSAGKPVVSTDLPEIRPFRHIVRIANDGNDFEQQVAMSLHEHDEGIRRQRVITAKENSWDNRAQDVLTAIEKVLEKR